MTDDPQANTWPAKEKQPTREQQERINAPLEPIDPFAPLTNPIDELNAELAAQLTEPMAVVRRDLPHGHRLVAGISRNGRLALQVRGFPHIEQSTFAEEAAETLDRLRPESREWPSELGAMPNAETPRWWTYTRREPEPKERTP